MNLQGNTNKTGNSIITEENEERGLQGNYFNNYGGMTQFDYELELCLIEINNLRKALINKSIDNQLVENYLKIKLILDKCENVG